jgi:hypothetical protein
VGTLTLGVDVGQIRDPTAIALVEVDRREAAPHRSETHFIVRYLARLPLGTPYPEVAARVAEVANRAHGRGGCAPTIYVDATGVGQPVVDLIVEKRSGGSVIAVYFTHGDRRTEEGRRVILGKAYLVSRLVALLQSRRVHLPESDEARTLAQELQDYEIRVDENANDRYGAFRVGTHDDLVTALGLAVQIDNGPTGGSGPLPWFADR